LTIADVDLASAVLTVRDSKFFKSRLVPLGDRTVQVLADYAKRRGSCAQSKETDTPFFLGRNAKRVNISTLENAFQQIRAHAGLRREVRALPHGQQEQRGAKRDHRPHVDLLGQPRRERHGGGARQCARQDHPQEELGQGVP